MNPEPEDLQDSSSLFLSIPSIYAENPRCYCKPYSNRKDKFSNRGKYTCPYHQKKNEEREKATEKYRLKMKRFRR